MPAYGHAAPPGQFRVSRNVWVVIAAVIVVVALLVGVIGYVFAGYAFASSRISDATGVVNTVNAHRSYVNTTFDLLNQQIKSFDTVRDNKASKSTSNQLVSESQSMSSTAGADDKALAAARIHLTDQQWLTPLSRGRLAAQAGRIDHALKAVATARSAGSDFLALGQFLQAYFQALIDWDSMIAAATNNDFVGATGADSTFQGDVAKAVQLSNFPGLPTELHDVLILLQAYAADVGKEFNAIGSGNKAAYDAAQKQVIDDVAKLKSIDLTATSAKIRTYYQHYRDDFNAEMDKATA